MDLRAAFFDTRAESWETKCYPPETRRRLEALIERFCVRSGERVLDMGTGTGVLIPYLRARVGNLGSIVSIDVSFEMIRRAARKQSTPRSICLRATAMNIPLRDASIDRVICFAAFPHFSGKREALLEMARVAQSGAEVFVAHLLSRMELKRHHDSHSAVAADELPDEIKMRELFAAAGLEKLTILDMPGMYIARAFKPARV